MSRSQQFACLCYSFANFGGAIGKMIWTDDSNVHARAWCAERFAFGISPAGRRCQTWNGRRAHVNRPALRDASRLLFSKRMVSYLAVVSTHQSQQSKIETMRCKRMHHHGERKEQWPQIDDAPQIKSRSSHSYYLPYQTSYQPIRQTTFISQHHKRKPRLVPSAPVPTSEFSHRGHKFTNW